MSHRFSYRGVLVLGSTLFLASLCPAAVLVPGPLASISVAGNSALADDPQAYNDRIDYAPGEQPQTVSLSRSGEGIVGGQVVARFSSSASQTSTLVSRPLELTATVDAAFAAHAERLPSNPSPNAMGSEGVSDFEVIVDVTDGPAVYSFSGTLQGNASMVRIVKSTPGGFEELHLLRGQESNGGVPFNFSGTIDPGRYSFRVNASSGIGESIPATIDTSGSVRGVSLRVTQVPEPAIGGLIAIGGAGSILRRRRPHAGNGR